MASRFLPSYASIQRHEVISFALEAMNDIAEHGLNFYNWKIQKIAWAVNETEWTDRTVMSYSATSILFLF